MYVTLFMEYEFWNILKWVTDVYDDDLTSLTEF